MNSELMKSTKNKSKKKKNKSRKNKKKSYGVGGVALDSVNKSSSKYVMLAGLILILVVVVVYFLCRVKRQEVVKDKKRH